VKQVKPLLFASLILLTASAAADTFYSPKACQGQRQLVLNNSTSEIQAVWLQFLGPNGHDSDVWELQPGQKKLLPEHALPRAEFSVRTSHPKVSVHTECDQKIIPWSNKTSPSRYWRVPAGAHLKFYVQNLNPHAQTIMLHFKNSQGELVGSTPVSMEMYMSTVVFKIFAAAEFVEIEGQGRFSTLLWTEGSFIPELKTSPVPVSITQSSYFLMARPDFTESFVVRVDDPAMATQARNLIKQGSMKLLFADIEYSPKSENRSLTDLESSPFSWRVKRVVGFNDFGPISCDGSPQMVEEEIFKWLATKRICFWGFKLKKELSIEEIQRGRLMP
jgi:hypothetical protein